MEKEFTEKFNNLLQALDPILEKTSTDEFVKIFEALGSLRGSLIQAIYLTEEK